MVGEHKTALLIVAPNDSQIFKAVRTWEDNCYDVISYSLTDVEKADDELIQLSNNHRENIRFVFTESALGSIPDIILARIIRHCKITPTIRWLHTSKRTGSDTERKILNLIVAPHDTQIDRAVKDWRERQYDVVSHALNDARRAADEIIGLINAYREDVRFVFTQSAWMSIPDEIMAYIIGLCKITPSVRWAHLSKKTILN